MELPEASSPSARAMAALAKAIGDRSLHYDIVKDPGQTLRRAEVPVDDLPEGVIDALRGLSAEDLGVVAEACENLTKHGFFIETPTGTVCFL